MYQIKQPKTPWLLSSAVATMCQSYLGRPMSGFKHYRDNDFFILFRLSSAKKPRLNAMSTFQWMLYVLVEATLHVYIIDRKWNKIRSRSGNCVHYGQ